MADVKENTSADISEEELKKEIEKILKDADLATTYTKNVIQKLEKNLGIDLKDKKKIIDQMVMDYVNSQESASEKSAEESGGDSDESDEPRPKRKQSRALRSGGGKSNVDNDEEEEEKPKKRKKKGSDDEWGSSGKKAAPKAKAKKGAGGARGKGSGYTRAYKLSPALSELMGKDEMPRHEVVKRVWEIIKEKQLYDPNNKQFAICDEALLKVFGTKRFRTFGMMKYLKTHFLDE